MALEKIIRYMEKDIEDWMFDNPNKVPFVDGWIDRQLILDNGTRLDLLGHIKIGGHETIVITELKARPVKLSDLIQLKRYEYHLIYTIERIGLISINTRCCLVGTNRDSINSIVVDFANALDIGIYSVNLGTNESLEIYGPWGFAAQHHDELQGKAKLLQKSGHYKNLTNYLMPLMPDFYYEYHYRDIERAL